jgi:dsRNA-specific ribonuclease
MVLCEPLLWTSPKLASNSFKDQVCVGDWFSSFKLSRLLAKKFSWHQNCKTNFSTPILLLLLLTGSHGWFQTKAFADTLEAYIGGIYIEKGPDSAMWCVESRLLPLLLLADPIRNPVAALKEQSELTFQVKPEYK